MSKYVTNPSPFFSFDPPAAVPGERPGGARPPGRGTAPPESSLESSAPLPTGGPVISICTARFVFYLRFITHATVRRGNREGLGFRLRG